MTGMPLVRRAISRRHLLRLVGGALTAASLASACALVPEAKLPPGGPGTPERIRLGFTSSVTGDLATLSAQQTQALELWARVVNALGGVTVGSRKLPIELKSYDDESRPERVPEHYQRLIEDDRVDFLISPLSSNMGAPSAATSEQYGKTNILAGVAADSVFAQGYQHVFQIPTPASKSLLGNLDMLRKVGPEARRVALINREEDLFSIECSKAAFDYASTQGFEVVLSESYAYGTRNFGPLLSRLASVQPDAILGGGHLEDGKAFALQLAQSQLKIKLLSLLVAPALPAFAQIGDAAAGVIAPSHWEPQVSFSAQSAQAHNIPYVGPTVKEFTAKYRQMFGYDPGYHAALFYTGGLVLEKAITDAGSIEQELVEAALKRMDLMTFYGRIKFDTEKHFGLQVGHEMVYLQWQKGAYRLERQIVWPEAAASAGLVYPKP